MSVLMHATAPSARVHGAVPLCLAYAAAGVAVAAFGAWTSTSGGASTWLVAGLAWAAHVLIDRGCGYGRRTEDGWQR